MRDTPPLHDGIALDPSQRLATNSWRAPSAPDLQGAFRLIIEATLRTLGEFARQMIARSKRRKQARATYLALRELDGPALRDLGFDRSEISSVAAEIAGDADSTRVRSARTPRGLPF